MYWIYAASSPPPPPLLTPHSGTLNFLPCTLANASRAFLLRDFVKRTMRYPKSSFDMGTVLDGGVLLVRIPNGQLGEDASRLLGSLILARVWQAATARAAIGVDARRDCSVFLDEAQNFLTLASSLDTMLAEARKYRLSMVLAHQDLAQFPRDLLAAV